MKPMFLRKFALPICYILVGILFIIYKAEVLKAICIFVGIIAALLGTINLVLDCINNKIKAKGFFIYDCLLISLGLIMILLSSAVIESLFVIVGIAYLVYGTYKVINSLTDVFLPWKWKILSILDGLLYLVTAILLLVNNKTLFIALGIILIVAGVMDVLSVYLNFKETKDFVDKQKKEAKKADAIDVIAEEKEDK